MRYAVCVLVVDPRLRTLPLSALAFALGVCVGRPQTPESTGRVALLAAELRRRGVYDDMLGSLDPELANAVRFLETADRGRRWAAGTGRRQP